MAVAAEVAHALVHVPQVVGDGVQSVRVVAVLVLT
jgi:hypothetical protein